MLTCRAVSELHLRYESIATIWEGLSSFLALRSITVIAYPLSTTKVITDYKLCSSFYSTETPAPNMATTVVARQETHNIPAKLTNLEWNDHYETKNRLWSFDTLMIPLK